MLCVSVLLLFVEVRLCGIWMPCKAEDKGWGGETAERRGKERCVCVCVGEEGSRAPRPEIEGGEDDDGDDRGERRQSTRKKKQGGRGVLGRKEGSARETGACWPGMAGRQKDGQGASAFGGWGEDGQRSRAVHTGECGCGCVFVWGADEEDEEEDE